MPGNSARCLSAWHAWVSTLAPQWHLCGTHKQTPKLMPTAMRTASLLSRSQFAIGSDKSQSPLCGATAARCLAICASSTKDTLIRERSAWSVPKRLFAWQQSSRWSKRIRPLGKISLKIFTPRTRTQSHYYYYYYCHHHYCMPCAVVPLLFC